MLNKDSLSSKHTIITTFYLQIVSNISLNMGQYLFRVCTINVNQNVKNTFALDSIVIVILDNPQQIKQQRNTCFMFCTRTHARTYTYTHARTHAHT